MHDPLAIAARFRLDEAPRAVERWGSGHIHETWRVRGERTSWLLQRVNHEIFRDVPALMENLVRVTHHLARGHVVAHPTLNVVPARDGAWTVRGEDGTWWRMFDFIENGRSHDTVRSAGQAYAAAAAFGKFQALLADLPPPPLREILPRFHDTPHRLAALTSAIALDPCHRADGVRAEIEFALARRRLAHSLVDAHRDGSIPARVTHNDTKLNNVLFAGDTDEVLCVVDLDTVMPGLALYDLGDLLRTAATRAAEDERDPGKVTFDTRLARAIIHGYLSTAGRMLTDNERDMIDVAGPVITLETGIRFLTDHLSGDTYFRIHRPGHNLDRCRAQFALVQAMERSAVEIARFAAQDD
jgi:Ser/Thr protein kinase RdoA (MazF antagonist)